MYSSKLYWTLSYFNLKITGCISISASSSLLGILIEITSSAIELKICTITAGIKMYKSIIKKKRKKHDKIALLTKSKLNSVKVLISKALFDLNVRYDNSKEKKATASTEKFTEK